MGDENAELQEEELEVLKSIYEGDELYRFESHTNSRQKEYILPSPEIEFIA